jgi:hypothetical protein
MSNLKFRDYKFETSIKVKCLSKLLQRREQHAKFNQLLKQHGEKIIEGVEIITQSS